MPDEIIELLNNKELREEVVKTIKGVYSQASDLYDNSESLKELSKACGTSLWEEAWEEAYDHYDEELDIMEEAFRKYVFDKMQKPYRIGSEEILENLNSIWIGTHELADIDPDILYTIFISTLSKYVLSDKCSEPFPICTVYGDSPLKDLDRYNDEKAKLWCKNGVSVRLVGKRYFKKSSSNQKLFYIDAIVDGHMSTLACKRLQAEISRILTTAIISALLLELVVSEFWPHVYFSAHPILVGGLTHLVNEDLLENKKVLIQKCIDAYYSEPTKKDSIGRRIQNAVCLLIESDAQSNDAVGLSLSFAAMEALLCEGRVGITEMLAQNAARLLEPDEPKRKDAIKLVKELYDHRSRILHGEKIVSESVYRAEARHLAAGVLFCMIEHVNFLNRCGCYPQSLQELLEDISKKRSEPGLPMGVSETNVRQLWGDPSGQWILKDMIDHGYPGILKNMGDNE